MANAFTGTGLTEFLGGFKSNPLYQQSQLQLQNQAPINQAVWNAYNQQSGATLPQQQVAGMDPNTLSGMQNQIGAASGTGAQLAGLGAGTLGTLQGGAGAGQSALTGIAGGLGPQFGSEFAGDYMSTIAPQLMGASQALNNQANMAWNKGVGGLGGVGEGFMSSGRDAALGQAKENAMTQLGAQQQMLAYNAAQQAAQAGQQAGMQGFQGQLAAGNALGNQALNAAQLTNNMQQAQLLPGQLQTSMGNALQTQQQNQLNAQYQNQMSQFQNPFKAIQNLNAGLGVLGSSNYAPNLNVPNNLIQGLNMMGINPQTLFQGAGQDLLKSIFGGGTGGGFGITPQQVSNIFGSGTGGFGITPDQVSGVFGGTSTPVPSLVGDMANVDSLLATDEYGWL